MAVTGWWSEGQGEISINPEGFIFDELSPAVLLLIAVGIAIGIGGGIVARSSGGKSYPLKQRKRGRGWVQWG